jgi:radical SAM superfamily enzyme YgiQ (UPF0313 family)
MFYPNPIEYEAPVYRPPSEGKSLLIQVTIGCSNNKCTYCDMYRSKTYRERSLEDIKKDLSKIKHLNPQKIFLCDGDALGASMELLESTLDLINDLFPEIRRIGIYATADNILGKSEEELRRLASKKLTIAYLGLESGDDEVLHMIVKGNTAQEMKDASLKIKNCGWQLSTIAMLGVGGKKHSANHITHTAQMLTDTAPHFFSFLTTFSVEGTPYDKMLKRGLIEPLTTKELLHEMYSILEQSNFKQNPVIFRANHVSNMYPLAGTLPRDQDNLLTTIKQWLDLTPEGQFPPRPHSM